MTLASRLFTFSVSSAVVASVFAVCTASCAIIPLLGCFGVDPVSDRVSGQKIAMRPDLRGRIERVLPREFLRQLSVPPLQRLDDLEMIDDRARGAIVLS